MKVSVIIPTYNEEKVIVECLESLSEQTYKDLPAGKAGMETIVIDDGSTDSTLSVLNTIHYSQFTIHLLRQKHLGPGEARNLGAKHARGEILVFVDADMTFDKDFIRDLVAPIINGDSKGTFSKNEFVSNIDNGWSLCWGINQGWEKGKRHPKDYPNTQKVFRAILKSEFDSAEGFDIGGHYTDDWSLSKKLGYEATVAPGAKFYHVNPDTLGEVFNQSKWAAKREYKLGWLGKLVVLGRTSLPISLITGVVKSLIYIRPQFLIFKLVYDFAALIGILEYILTGRGFK